MIALIIEMSKGRILQMIFLKPVFKQMIWGGNRLGTDWGYDIPGDNTGECWAIAAHQNGDCEVLNGEYAGKKLSELWRDNREIFGNIKGDVFPLLIKIIDAKADLSIQVHPDDEYAAKNENGSLGKTECWYILDCEKDSTLIIGHHAKNHEELESMIREGRWKEFLQEIPVKKGDFIQIDPGTLHAIKGGIMLLETQQNSDITYRVYDYDRLSDGKPRQLHVEQSIETIKAPSKPISECVSHPDGAKINEEQSLIHNSFYDVKKLTVNGKAKLEAKDIFICVSVLEGEGTIAGERIKRGDHFIIPANTDGLCAEGNFTIIYSTIG